MKQSISYTIGRKVKGSRTFFYPLINGKRLTRTNFARKYDARNLVKAALKDYGAEKLHEIFYK
jgi:hypothetical protein